MGAGRARAACPRQGHRFSSSLPIPLLAGEADPVAAATGFQPQDEGDRRSEEHTSELQPLMRISYAVFCLKKTKLSHSLSKSYPFLYSLHEYSNNIFRIISINSLN